MKIVVCGSDGQLGREFISWYRGNTDLIGLNRNSLDITDYGRVLETLSTLSPDIVINCAAFTNVDGAERHPNLSHDVNAAGVENLARVCRALRAKLVHFSTDYVFDGNSETPYAETATPCPVNEYGRSKLAGEKLIQQNLEPESYAIVRIGWVYSSHGTNFLSTMIKLAMGQPATGESKNRIRIVSDETGSPTWTQDIVRQVQIILGNNLSGMLHVAASGECSRIDFWHELAREVPNLPEAVPTCSEDFQRLARRPGRSSLSCEVLRSMDLYCLPEWKDGLRTCLGKSPVVRQS